ncbi:hypothetical protein ACU5EH_10050 [Aliivibrio salmonicida]|uniref:hypothetical protein n=1 Tax=Aliivibrio salmonicida TaxID=40269 RepID=UPI00406C6B84
MSSSNKTIEERLKWLKPKDPKIALWFRKYARTHQWIYRYSSNKIGITDQEFCSQFIVSWSIEEAELDEEKEDDFYNIARGRLNLLKSAWRSHSSKNVNSTFSLTPYSKKRLGILSTKANVSKTRIVESLISLADDINHLEGELRKLIKSNSIKDINVKEEVDFLNTIINYSGLYEEKEDLFYTNKDINKKIKELEAENERLLKLVTIKESSEDELKEELEATTEGLQDKELEQNFPQELTNENEYINSELSESTTQLKQSKRNRSNIRKQQRKQKKQKINFTSL